jgi:hypothetical protein
MEPGIAAGLAAGAASDRDAIRHWLDGFDAEARDSVLKKRDVDQKLVIGPLHMTADLLLAPAVRVPQLFSCLRNAMRSNPAGTELCWLLEIGSQGTTGLGLEDLHALFTAWMRVTEVKLSRDSGRAVVSARVREYAVAFVVDLTRTLNDEDHLGRILQALKRSSARSDTASIVGAFVVLDHDLLRASKRQERHDLYDAIQQGWVVPVAKVDTDF